MPVYNSARYVSEAISSVLNQTFRDFELIVIDDCSKDGSLTSIHAFCNDERLIVLTNETNLRAAGTRNRGIAAARGDYIAFIDSDDIWHPDFLQSQLEILTGEPDIALLGCDFDFIDSDGKDITPVEVQRNRVNHHAGLRHYELDDLWNHAALSPSSWVVRATTVRSSGLFNEKLDVCEDRELILRLSMIGKICENPACS